MDVRQYFEPIDFSKYSDKFKEKWKYSLGQTIEKSTNKITPANIHKIEVVVFSVPFYNGTWKSGKTNPTEKIREELYRLSTIDRKLSIVDFGQLKKTKSQKGAFLAVRDIIEYFTELNIVTLLIGGSQDLTVGICEAFKSETFFSLTSVDSVLDVKKGRETFSSTNFLTRVFQKNPQIFQFNLVGYQTHLVPRELFSKTKGLVTHVRLGLLHEDSINAEPVFRNTDVLSFDSNALKYSEINGSQVKNPNGLYSEEACQLAKYAGLSNKLKVFGIFETDWDKDNNGISFKLSAQIIWYFLEGFLNRVQKEKELPENLQMYKVEVKEIDEPIVFYKCTETARWWFEIQSIKGNKYLIACSKKEYDEASGDEIPENWLKFVQKIDELSK
ncbi:arginase family protein [Maribellus maritimus]|uniref:arginase family protein n=1 Tax=Maribellus maritimus TaxID=2870838 RepID=UPI001EEAE999|nr:arginase family protein [Maribellus maritimus]MCG6189614.1 arginase family protein [Maribellus maritimus]